VTTPGPEASTAPPTSASRLLGVLVTYRRPDDLATSLAVLAAQTRPLDRLVVVDNAASPATRAQVDAADPRATYLDSGENLGPAGGIALGMDELLASARDDDWVVVLDDDDAPRRPDALAVLGAFADETRARDPRTGAVGLTGARFDRRRGRTVRVPDDELHGAVRVDYVAGNQVPLYSVRALRAVGVAQRDLFFGFDDLELGLRLQDAGFALFASGATWRRAREDAGRLGAVPGPARTLAEPGWRRYYSQRNLVAILRAHGAPAGAARVTAVVAIAKPLANLVRSPGLALRHLGLGIRASFDGWTGRLGRRVEPS
jgi:glycosyltransferase involved in cell wall biosynthesis